MCNVPVFILKQKVPYAKHLVDGELFGVCFIFFKGSNKVC